MSSIRTEEGDQAPDDGAEIHTLEVGERAKVVAAISRGGDERQPRPYRIDRFDGRDKKFEAFFSLVQIEGERQRLPSEDEAAYVKYFNGTMGNLADYELRDEKGDKGQVNLPEVLTARDEFATALIEEAENFIGGSPVLDCFKTTAKKRGRFEEKVRVIRHANHAVTVWRSPGSDIDDIRFNVLATDLNGGQQKLIIEIQKALTVVTVVFKEKQRRPRSQFISWFSRAIGTAEQTRQQEVSRRNYYVGKLADIVRNAFADPKKLDYTTAALEAFKNEFVAREADLVKNRYVRSLGRRAAIYGLIFFGAYWFSRYLPSFMDLDETPNDLVLYRYKEFFALATGACAGAWLSFAIRRVVLGFTDLALLEDDRLKPTSRIFFVVGLTMVVGMLLQTHMVGFVVGTTPITLTSGLLSLLIGTLCGISERALTNVVSRRADDFAGRLGGQPPRPAATWPTAFGRG
jgi:hypothetical protein